ncbi:hypothetical protein PR048_026700 [Dryococelus australis]|uniref:HTH CENPB-type domain-containing protein n=1 Tax=Dryococelus australis TaxID=614101 RepID=A0ABQ9GM49_9NEOP|nr:hypothetical protein PR048_026700 [Dryococelus australis]
MVKAEEFTKKLKDDEFVCSAGWIDRFLLRHNITFGKVSGEARGVNTETATEWLSTVQPSICEGYAGKDVFNADEISIFFRFTPDRTLKFKEEKCVCGKLSKERNTILGPGTSNKEKKDHLAYRQLQNLEDIKHVFLTANTTRILQPMDQGIIKSLKCHYCKLILIRIVKSIKKKQYYILTLLDAIRFIEKAWRQYDYESYATIDDDIVSEVKNDHTEDAEKENDNGGEERSEVSTPTNEDGSSSRKAMKTAENKELEEAVFKLFLQQRELGNPLSGQNICQKAKLLAKKIDRKEGSTVMLILNNAPTHPTESLLDTEDGHFKTIFLLPNVTSLLQPMDQLVVENMKRHYRRQLLRKLLIEDENEDSIVAHHQKLDLKDCSYLRAWNNMKGISTKEEEQKENEGKKKHEEEEREAEDDEMTLEDL